MRTTQVLGFALAGTVALVAFNVFPQTGLARDPGGGPRQSSQKLQPQKGNRVLLPGDRLVVGTVEEVTAAAPIRQR